MQLQNIGSQVTEPFGDANIIRSLENAVQNDKTIISEDRPQSTLERLNTKGRMTAENRIRALCDENTAWFLNEYQGFDMPREGHNKPYRLGVICALGCICGRQAIIIANDNTITAGSWWPGTPQKITHTLDMALRLQIPVFYLIECAGLYLPHQDETFAGQTGAGSIFEKQAQLNRSGILQVAAILGDCIAGGGYMPLMCDKIVMTETATLCIGGAAVTSQSKGKIQEKLGTAAVHVHQSGCADIMVPDDESAIQKLRTWASQMPASACDFYRIDEPIDPPYETDDLYHLIPIDPAKPYDMEQIVARIADGAQIQPLLDHIGHEIFAASALVDGLPVVILANRTLTTQDSRGQHHAGSILYREGIIKMRQICECANSDGIPVIWIQDVAGFDIGEQAESEGLLRHGAMLIRELANDGLQAPPHMTIILRKASGAGYYAMKGTPFHPAITIATAFSHIEVMSPETLAGTLFDRKINSLPHQDPMRIKLEQEKAEVIRKQKNVSTPQKAAMRGDIDDIIPLSSLRSAVIRFVRCAWQNASRPSKPVRLWSLFNHIQ